MPAEKMYLRESLANAWKEAAIAWEVCMSVHKEYAKGKDPLYIMRQADFVRHAEAARKIYQGLDGDSGSGS